MQEIFKFKMLASVFLIVLIIPFIFAGIYTHTEAQSKLQGAGIGISSSGSCNNKNNRQCTSLDGIHEEAIDGIITLRQSSGCQITITGGTEVGHAFGSRSHGNGWKLDIRKNDCINNYIKRNFQSIGGSKWKAGSGNIYFDEGNHWDIQYNT